MGHGPHHAPSIDYHRSLSVRHINHRLNIEGRSKNKPISDGIIVAVSVLVNTEVSRPYQVFRLRCHKPPSPLPKPPFK